MLKGDTEKKYWKMITYEYMSQESSDSDEESTYKVHSPVWRSSGIFLYNNYTNNYFENLALSSLIKKLDCRLDKKESAAGKRVSGFARYKRIPSQPLMTCAPTSAPLWAVQVPVPQSGNNLLHFGFARKFHLYILLLYSK